MLAHALAGSYAGLMVVFTVSRQVFKSSSWIMPHSLIIGLAVVWTVLSQVLAILEVDQMARMVPGGKLHGTCVALPQQALLVLSLLFRGDLFSFRGLLLLLNAAFVGAVLTGCPVVSTAPLSALVASEFASLVLTKVRLPVSDKSE
eukprot:TRINITY_DN46855_c0_g1_i1.p1 TRINITY_DN46855_c0_g1~~TRINITY_DN46855_c0_g1_i1.p1  ORF type:complete len:146 (+),score=33.29 TRINITY_DN46855_c0_g1_i1:78-515(+)